MGRSRLSSGVRWGLAAVLAAVAAGVAGAVVLDRTTAGRALALNWMLDRLQPLLDGTIQVGSVGPGGIWGGATLRELVVLDGQGTPGGDGGLGPGQILVAGVAGRRACRRGSPTLVAGRRGRAPAGRQEPAGRGVRAGPRAGQRRRQSRRQRRCVPAQLRHPRRPNTRRRPGAAERHRRRTAARGNRSGAGVDQPGAPAGEGLRGRDRQLDRGLPAGRRSAGRGRGRGRSGRDREGDRSGGGAGSSAVLRGGGPGGGSAGRERTVERGPGSGAGAIRVGRLRLAGLRGQTPRGRLGARRSDRCVAVGERTRRAGVGRH